MKKTLLIGAAVLIPAVAAGVANLAFGIDHGLAGGTAIFTTTVILWVSELIPPAATALLVPVLIVLYGAGDVSSVFAPFGNHIIFLFVGTFFLARAMEKHGWDRRMAYTLLSSRYSPRSLFQTALALSLMAFVLSMWISNTATTAVFCPVVLGIIHVLREVFDDEEELRRNGVYLLLLVAYSASIGGISTPMGTAPNLITIGFLSKAGLEINFLEWVSIALPVAVCMLVVLNALLKLLLRPNVLSGEVFSRMREKFSRELHSLGPIKRSELTVSGVFFLAVFLWVLPGLLEIAFPGSEAALWAKERIPMSAVGMFVGVILFMLPARDGMVLDWGDAKHIDWGTILLFGGGLSLGAMLENVGISGAVGSAVFSFGAENPAFLLVLVVAAAVFATEVTSNTATCTIIVSVLLGALSDTPTLSEAALIIAVCLATSYAFMLPVATPPNAIVFGTGQIKIREMMRVGFFLNLAAIALIYLSFELVGIVEIIDGLF